jgi:hypothetical protein
MVGALTARLAVSASEGARRFLLRHLRVWRTSLQLETEVQYVVVRVEV